MSRLVTYIVDGYIDLMDNKSDQRVKDWFLMSSPLPTLAICLSYVYIVKVLGPKIMENRKPFELKNVLIFYNLFQVIFSTWLFYESCVAGWFTHYSYRCQPVDYSTAPVAMRMVYASWWYYFSKFTEFFDTFFFVLRKKNDHISTLHVIHHGIMPMSVWFGVKFTPGGHSTFFGFLNTFVHIIMYSYYLVAALGPQFQKYLWWKKYLTAIQMVQFVLVMVHAFQLLFIDCNYPKAFVWFIGMHAVMFYFLFSNFYKETYNKKARKAKLEDESCVAGWLTHYSYRCQPVDYSTTPLVMRMVNGCWWYYFSKFTEFFDTFFFVLRKKNDHISTLHVIHHGIMPMSVWFGVKFTPGGHSTFFGFLNTFVHIIMYSYYLVAALGPQFQKYLWWKKYLTTIQMVQFVLVMVHAFQLLFIDCNYPKAFVWWIGMHAVMFYFLFSNFYKETYNKKARKAKIEAEAKMNGTSTKKSKTGICFTSQTALYENSNDVKGISNGYTSADSNTKLRNRAFIGNAKE